MRTKDDIATAVYSMRINAVVLTNYNDHMADEIMQMVCLKLFKAIDKLPEVDNDFLSYVNRSITNCFVDIKRAETRMHKNYPHVDGDMVYYFDSNVSINSHDGGVIIQSSVEIKELLAAIMASDKIAFKDYFLYCLEGYTTLEIMAITGEENKNTVLGRIRYARKAIKKLMVELGWSVKNKK